MENTRCGIDAVTLSKSADGLKSAGGHEIMQVMEYNQDKVDEVVLALLYLTLHDGQRAWKGHDWEALGRLHEKGLISDPVSKAKSVVLSERGLKLCEELFQKHFGAAAK